MLISGDDGTLKEVTFRGKKLKGRFLNSYARVGARRYDNWKLKLGQQDI